MVQNWRTGESVSEMSAAREPSRFCESTKVEVQLSSMMRQVLEARNAATSLRVKKMDPCTLCDLHVSLSLSLSLFTSSLLLCRFDGTHPTPQLLTPCLHPPLFSIFFFRFLVHCLWNRFKQSTSVRRLWVLHLDAKLGC